MTTWDINMTQMLEAVSNALDCVEGDLMGVSMHHAKRLACLCASIGRQIGLDEHELFDLCACALLHDNALPEYLATEYRMGTNVSLGSHCVSGERNMKRLPVYGDITNVLLYHHENADGSGPFGKKGDEIPLYAKIIHLVDILDATFDFQTGALREQDVLSYLRKQSGIMFDSVITQVLICTDSFHELLESVREERLSETVVSALPRCIRSLTPAQVADFSALFAKIVDYKSEFVANHSQGVMEKAVRMADFYGVDELERTKLLLAGSLHDIGKLVISNDILEKPGRLTRDEFQVIQVHSYATYEILRQIEGLEDVTAWASYHHEKLDGSGYPFGLTADKLDRNSRLMACIDIYQAMTEERPYKARLSHAEAMQELYRLAELGKIDMEITKDIDQAFASGVTQSAAECAE